MQCYFCEKEIYEPILSNDGECYCPNCFSNMFGEYNTKELSQKINFDPLSMQEYLKSEMLYNDMDQGKKMDLHQKRSLSLKKCRNAASLGSAHAMINMGYYFEKGEIVADDSSRLFNALMWYNTVALLDGKYASMTKMGVVNVDATIFERCDELIETALYDIYCLLKQNDLENFNRNFFYQIFKDNFSQQDIVNNLLSMLKQRKVFEIMDIEDNTLNFSKKNDNTSLFGNFYSSENLIYELIKVDTEYVFGMIRVKGMDLYKSIFELSPVEKSALFKKFVLNIRIGKESLSITNSRDFDLRYENVISKSTYEDSILIYYVKKDKSIKFTCLDKGIRGDLNNIKKEALFVSHNFASAVDSRNSEDKLSFGNFTTDDIKIYTIAVARSKDVKNSKSLSACIRIKK